MDWTRPQILPLKVRVKVGASLAAAGFLVVEIMPPALEKWGTRHPLYPKTGTPQMLLSCGVSISETGGNHREPSASYSFVTSRWIGLIDIYFASCSEMLCHELQSSEEYIGGKISCQAKRITVLAMSTCTTRLATGRWSIRQTWVTTIISPRSLLCRGIYE